MRLEKAYAVEEIGKMMDRSSSLVLTTFTGLDTARMNLFRKTLREKSGRYLVVKNTLLAIAARQRQLDHLCALLKGQVGLVFAEDDSLELLKTVVNFGKENQELKIIGGFFDGEVRSAEEMLAIAAMPPREVVAGGLVSTLMSPLSGLVQTLNEVLRGFVFVLSSIQEKKGNSGSGE